MSSKNKDNNNDEEISPSSSSSIMSSHHPQLQKDNQNATEKNENPIIMDKANKIGSSKVEDKNHNEISTQEITQQKNTNSNLVNASIQGHHDVSEKQEHHNNNINPLEMVDIVPTVLKYMDSSSLKSSIMVSQLWHFEGIKMFLENNYIRIPFNIHGNGGDDAEDADENRTIISEQLKDTLSKYKGVINIKIHNTLDIPLFQKLEMNGNKVNLVQLSPLFYAGAEGDEDKICRLNSELFTFCPSMKVLDTGLIFETDKYEMELPIRLKFGTCLMLTCIEFGFGKEDKPLTLTHLSSVAMDEDQLMVLEYFAKTGVKVINFCLYFNSHCLEEDGMNFRAIRTAMKILMTSQNVLESYSFNGNDLFCSSMFEMPMLPHLRSLSIDLKLEPSIGIPIIFHPDFKFDVYTPKLEEVTLSIVPDSAPNDEEVLERVFEHTGKASSVKKLYYINKCERLETESLFETFSEIEELTVDNGKIEWQNVWTNCRKIKTLELNVQIKNEDEGLEFLSKFLGFSLIDLKRIWNHQDQDLDEIKKLSPSMPILQELTDMKIFLDDAFSLDFAARVWAFIRDFSIDYMPKLKSAQAFMRQTTISPQEHALSDEEYYDYDQSDDEY